MHELIIFDFSVFEWLNSSIQNPVFDALMPWIRNKYLWVPLYFFLIAWIFNTRPWRKALIVIFSLLTLVSLTDLTSGQILKKSIKRLRPCNESVMEDRVIMRIPCRQSYSFPSSHATNHFAIAAFFGFLIAGWKKIALYLWAAVICLAQIYVGLHFPLDIAAGAILGILMARLVYRLMTVPGLLSVDINPDTDNRLT